MGNRLPHGLGGRGHWLDMLGAGEGKVKAGELRHVHSEKETIGALLRFAFAGSFSQ